MVFEVGADEVAEEIGRSSTDVYGRYSMYIGYRVIGHLAEGCKTYILLINLTYGT